MPTIVSLVVFIHNSFIDSIALICFQIVLMHSSASSK